MRGTESTLFRKILTLLLVSVYVPLLLFGFFSYRELSARLENATAAFLLDHLQNNALRLHEMMNAVERHSVLLYSSEKLQKLLRDDANGEVAEFEFLNEATRIRSELAGPYYFSVLSRNWERVERYGILRSDAPLSGRDWFDRALMEDGQGFWLHEFKYEFGVEQSDFYFARAVRSLYPPTFQNLGVISIRLPVSMVQSALVETERYPSYRLMLLNEEGRDMLRPQQSGTAARLKTQVAADGTLRKITSDSGELLYAAAVPIGSEGWVLAATVSAADATGQIRQMWMFIALFVLLSVLVITSLLVWVASSFTDPLRRIARHMKKIQHGSLEDYPHARDGGRTDEIGQLTRGFNSMIRGMSDMLVTIRRSEEEKRELEMQMLMQQINPHFLYNTLDSIKWRADMAGQTGISDMVRSLADLLRFSLDDLGEWTTLERELEHVKTYIGIEQLRKGSFRVLFNVGSGLGSLPFMKLILQPIVENSIRHGIRRLPAGEGKLIVTVYREAESGDIVCTIEDNGRQCTMETVERLNRIGREEEKTNTIGLPNVSRRLRRAFGNAYGLSFERTSGGGLRAIIRHPALQDHIKTM